MEHFFTSTVEQCKVPAVFCAIAVLGMIRWIGAYVLCGAWVHVCGGKGVCCLWDVVFLVYVQCTLHIVHCAVHSVCGVHSVLGCTMVCTVFSLQWVVGMISGIGSRPLCYSLTLLTSPRQEGGKVNGTHHAVNC